MPEKKKLLAELFGVFFKIGAFTFGGGYAMIPFIQREMVEHKKWIDEDELLDIIAVAEATPGPISINAATFIGYHVAGFWGALLSTAALVLPAFTIITIVYGLFSLVKDNKWVSYAFAGVRAGVICLILSAVVKLFSAIPKNRFTIAIGCASLLLTLFTNVSVILILIGAFLAGILYNLRDIKKAGGK